MIVANLPDGSSHQFPDGTPDSVIDNTIQQYVGASQGSNVPPSGIAHTTGVAGRAVAEGLPSILDIPARLQQLEYKGLGYGIDKAMGVPYDAETVAKPTAADFPAPSDWVSKGLDALGVPKPNPGPETVGFDTLKGLSGVAGSYGLGATGVLDNAASKFLTTKPLNQALAAGMGSAAGSTAKEAGLPPEVQMAASLAGGIAAPSALSAVGTGTGALYDAARGFVQKPDSVVGQALKSMANDPDAAIAAVRSAPQYVPNSPMTLGEASGDRGLIGMQSGMRNSDPAAKTAFGTLEASQNSARNEYFDTLTGSQQDLADAIKARDLKGGQLRAAAFKNAQPVNLQPVHGNISGIQASPSGAQQAVESSMDWARGRLGKLNPTAQIQIPGEDAFGASMPKNVPGYDPESVYSVRKDVGDAVQGKFGQENPLLVHAGSQLKNVRGSLDSAIEEAAPGYKDYMSTYADMSKPINQMEALQQMRAKILSSNVQDPTTKLPLFAPQQFSNYLKNNAEDLDGVLSDPQKTGLTNLHSDLQRTQSTLAQTVKTQNSSTAMNGNVQQAASDILAKQVQGIPLVGKYLYQSRQDALNQALLDAYLNPAKGANLMENAKTAVPAVPLAQTLKQKMMANLLGASLAQ